MTYYIIEVAMPHVIVDYSENLTGLNAKQLLEEINTTLIDTELFSQKTLKAVRVKMMFFSLA